MLSSEIHIRSAKAGDLPGILTLFEQARHSMKEQGIDQWQDGYPQKELLVSDIESGNAYVLTEEETVLGYFYFSAAREPAYDTVENGEFRESGKAGVVHRVAVMPRVRGKGLGRAIFDYAVKLSHIELCVSLRCDTHENNHPMRGLLAKCGFLPCGNVYYGTDEHPIKRIAYDLLI